VGRLTRPGIGLSTTQKLLASIRDKNSLGITYRAKSRRIDRDICPHSIIFASNRYHVRAYCHVSMCFLDFVVSRIEQA